MTYREQLEQRVQSEWEGSSVPVDTESGRGFEFLTIVMAIISFIKMCVPTPTPNPTPGGRAASDDDLREGGQVTVGLKRHLRKQYREDYGRRGAKREWDANGPRSLAVANKVATTATYQEVEGLRSESARAASSGPSNGLQDHAWDNG